MANTLGNYNVPLYANLAARWLSNRLGFARRLTPSYDRERAAHGKGDTINIRRPAVVAAQSAPGSVQDMPTESLTMTLNGWQEVRMAITDKEWAYAGEQFAQDHIRPMAYALAFKIESDLATMIPTVPHLFMEASAGTAATVAGIATTYEKLFTAKCPVWDEENMFFAIGGKEQNDLTSLAAFSQWQGAGQVGVGTQLTGQLGRRYGFEFFATQLRPTISYNDIAVTDLQATVTAAAKGATTLLLAGLASAAEVYKKGTIIKVTSGAAAGDEYAIAADTTDKTTTTVTVTINPPLRTALAGTETIIVGNGTATASGQDNVTNNANVAFHREWASLAFAKLPEYSSGDGLGVVSQSVAEEQSGVQLRLFSYFDGANSRRVIVLDALYGFKELNADLACRYEIKNT